MATAGEMIETYPYEEIEIGAYRLLVVEKEPGLYRLYVGTDGEQYCHYDSGSFRSLEEATEAAVNGFNPSRFLAFPYTPYRRSLILKNAPHGFDEPRGAKGQSGTDSRSSQSQQ